MPRKSIAPSNATANVQAMLTALPRFTMKKAGNTLTFGRMVVTAEGPFASKVVAGLIALFTGFGGELGALLEDREELRKKVAMLEGQLREAQQAQAKGKDNKPNKQ